MLLMIKTTDLIKKIYKFIFLIFSNFFIKKRGNNTLTCKLCKRNEATKRNSHIFSAFFVEDVIGKRDTEESYIISTDPNIKYNENKRYKTVKTDYILCECCEERIAYAENYFAAEFSRKFRKLEFAPNFPIKTYTQGYDYVICERVNPIAFTLFIYSLFWRASITKNIDILKNKELDNQDEEQLRIALNSLLPICDSNGKIAKISKKDWVKFLEENKYKLPNISFMYATSRDEDNQIKYKKIQEKFNESGITLDNPIEYYPIGSLLDIDFVANGKAPYSLFIGENIIQLKPDKFPIINKGEDKIKIFLIGFDYILSQTLEMKKLIAMKRANNK